MLDADINYAGGCPAVFKMCRGSRAAISVTKGDYRMVPDVAKELVRRSFASETVTDRGENVVQLLVCGSLVCAVAEKDLATPAFDTFGLEIHRE